MRLAFACQGPLRSASSFEKEESHFALSLHPSALKEAGADQLITTWAEDPVHFLGSGAQDYTGACENYREPPCFFF